MYFDALSVLETPGGVDRRVRLHQGRPAEGVERTESAADHSEQVSVMARAVGVGSPVRMEPDGRYRFRNNGELADGWGAVRVAGPDGRLTLHITRSS